MKTFVVFLILTGMALGAIASGPLWIGVGRRQAELALGIRENQEWIIANIKRLGGELQEVKPIAQRLDDWCRMTERAFPEIWAIRGRLDDFGRFNLLMGRPLDMRPTQKPVKKD
jgi:hypothetical protein